MGFVVWGISGHFGGVHVYPRSDGTFLFCFVYAMYLNIASYLYGKQIKSKVGNKFYLWMIFIFVNLNRLDLHECRTMILKSVTSLDTRQSYSCTCISRCISVLCVRHSAPPSRQSWSLHFSCIKIWSNLLQVYERNLEILWIIVFNHIVSSYHTLFYGFEPNLAQMLFFTLFPNSYSLNMSGAMVIGY